MDDLILRLRAANEGSTQRALGSHIFEEAANRIEQLEGDLNIADNYISELKNEIDKLKSKSPE